MSRPSCSRRDKLTGIIGMCILVGMAFLVGLFVKGGGSDIESGDVIGILSIIALLMVALTAWWLTNAHENAIDDMRVQNEVLVEIIDEDTITPMGACNICHLKFTPQRGYIATPCEHTFHADCYDRYQHDITVAREGPPSIKGHDVSEASMETCPQCFLVVYNIKKIPPLP